MVIPEKLPPAVILAAIEETAKKNSQDEPIPVPMDKTFFLYELESLFNTNKANPSYLKGMYRTVKSMLICLYSSESNIVIDSAAPDVGPIAAKLHACVAGQKAGRTYNFASQLSFLRRIQSEIEKKIPDIITFLP